MTAGHKHRLVLDAQISMVRVYVNRIPLESLIEPRGCAVSLIGGNQRKIGDSKTKKSSFYS